MKKLNFNSNVNVNVSGGVSVASYDGFVGFKLPDGTTPSLATNDPDFETKFRAQIEEGRQQIISNIQQAQSKALTDFENKLNEQEENILAFLDSLV